MPIDALMTRLTLGAIAALASLVVSAGCGGNSAESSLPDSFVAVRQHDNPVIPGDGRYTELLRLGLPSGRYQVSGKVELQNRDPAAPLTVQCALIPARTDGTAGTPDDVGTDWGFLHLNRSGEAGDQAAIVLLASQALDADGSAALGCEGSGGEPGAFGAYITIRAIEVLSVSNANR